MSHPIRSNPLPKNRYILHLSNQLILVLSITLPILLHCLAGGLCARRQPLEDVLHGRVRSTISVEDPSQGIISTVHCCSPSQDRMLVRVQHHELPISQPKCPGRGRGWRARSRRPVSRSTVRLCTFRAGNLHQCSPCRSIGLSCSYIWAALKTKLLGLNRCL